MNRSDPTRDRGSVLPLVLVVGVILAGVVLALASYTVTTMRSGNISESRSDSFASAQAALEDALENFELGNELCTTNAGLGVVRTDFPGAINGTTAYVDCTRVGGDASSLDGWAVVLTGNGTPNHELVIQSGNGVLKYIGGKVYMNDPTKMNLQSSLEIRGGNLYSPGCTTPIDPSSLDSNLSFADSYTTACTTMTWDQMFSEPLTEAPPGGTPNVDPPLDPFGCKVFDPGVYNTAPVLGDHNYFRNGVYLFNDVGTIVVKQSTVTFGNLPTSVEGFPAIDNDPCDPYRTGTDNSSGATVYVAGSTRFDIEAQGGLEFSSREQRQPFPDNSNLKKIRVSLQVVPGGAGVPPSWNDPLVETKAGNQKQLAVQGLVWAPDAGFVFGEVTNDTAAVLRGGAVLAKLDAGASASATGFLIEVPTSPEDSRLQLTATAETGGVDVSVRAVVQYRPTDNAVAVNTWRVCEQAC